MQYSQQISSLDYNTGHLLRKRRAQWQLSYSNTDLCHSHVYPKLVYKALKGFAPTPSFVTSFFSCPLNTNISRITQTQIHKHTLSGHLVLFSCPQIFPVFLAFAFANISPWNVLYFYPAPTCYLFLVNFLLSFHVLS